MNGSAGSPARMRFRHVERGVWHDGGRSRAHDGGTDVNRGQAVYERHCLACHGVSSRGDGPEAALLGTRPANFHRTVSMPKSDEELLRIIEYGVVFSPMHAWQGKLTEDELTSPMSPLLTRCRENSWPHIRLPSVSFTRLM